MRISAPIQCLLALVALANIGAAGQNPFAASDRWIDEDAFTGDVSGWWDHHFAEEPKALYIEATPGGGFFEIFDDAGNGAMHAQVTHANRGKMLQFTGPLGLASLKGPIHMVHTFEFKEAGEGGTAIELRVAAVGELQQGMGAVVQRVWDHFLDGQFKPWVEAGKHRER